MLPAEFRYKDLNPSLILPMQRDRSKTYLGNFQLSGAGAAQAGSHHRTGQRRRRPHDPSGARRLPAASWLQQEHVRGALCLLPW